MSAQRHGDLDRPRPPLAAEAKELEKWAVARLGKKAIDARQVAMAELPDGGRLFALRLRSDGATLFCKRTLPKEPTLAKRGRRAGDGERRRMKGSKARPGGGDDEGRSGEGATK